LRHGLFNHLKDSQIGIVLTEAFCFQLLRILLDQLRLKRGAAPFSMVVATQPDVDVSGIRDAERQILLAGYLRDLDRDLRMGAWSRKKPDKITSFILSMRSPPEAS